MPLKSITNSLLNILAVFNILFTVKYKASSKCTCSWFYKETQIQQSQSIQVFHEKVDTSSFECRLEIQDPGPDTAGMYKCLVSNEKGEINANLMLNIQLAQRSVYYFNIRQYKIYK